MKSSREKQQILPVERVHVRVELPVDGRLEVVDPLQGQLEVVSGRDRLGLGELELLLDLVLLGVHLGK